jgi:hypothetical protein
VDSEVLDRELAQLAHKLDVPLDELARHLQRATTRRQISASFATSSIELLDRLASQLGWTKSKVLESGLLAVEALVDAQRTEASASNTPSADVQAHAAKIGDSLFDRLQGSELQQTIADAFQLSAADLGARRSPSRLGGR